MQIGSSLFADTAIISTMKSSHAIVKSAKMVTSEKVAMSALLLTWNYQCYTEAAQQVDRHYFASTPKHDMTLEIGIRGQIVPRKTREPKV